MEKKRKRRSDRTHVVYRLTNTVTGEIYIGITVATGRAYVRSLKERWKRHVSRATRQTMEWNLCNSIRQYGERAFSREIIHLIRGKAAAHSMETALIHSLKPALNSTIKTH
jgi:hypothetical protein